MKLYLENVDSKHYAWLCQMAKALNITITDIDMSSEESSESSFAEESETAYLLSTEANKNHLKESLGQANDGKTTKVDIKKLWK